MEHVSLRWDDPRPRHRVVYVDDDHICTNLCHNHYWNGSRVVVLTGHRHHADCGHIFRGSRWVVVNDHDDHVRFGGVHVCTHDCHHHY